MIDKIKNFQMMAYIACVSFFAELKDDERGLSDAVTTVLLILVAVLAVVALWGFLDGWLTDMFKDITDKSVIE